MAALFHADVGGVHGDSIHALKVTTMTTTTTKIERKNVSLISILIVIAVVIAVVPTVSAIENSELTLLYRFEDTDIYKAIDSSMYGNDGNYTITPIYTSSKGGNETGDSALMFTPIEVYGGVQINSGDTIQIDSTTSWTVGWWAKAEYAPDGYWVYSKCDGTSCLAISIDLNGYTALEMIKYDVGEITVIGDNAVSDNEWHHYIITNDGSDTAGGVLMYNDGVLIGDSENNNYPTGGVANTATGYLGGNGLFSYGPFDEFFVINRTLTQEEITQVYNLGVESIITAPPPAPYVPANTTLKPNQCPSTLPDVGILWLMVIIAFGLILLGILLSVGLLGILGSIGLIVLAWTIIACSTMFGWLLMLTGLFLLIWFALRRPTINNQTFSG
jgi:hypothetical protein